MPWGVVIGSVARTMTSLDEFTVQLRRRLAQRWMCNAPIPISAADLMKLRASMPGVLPVFYVRFLEVCGGGRAAGLFESYHWSPDSRLSRNAELRLVTREFGVSLPRGALTFLDYIGDYFWGFNLDDGENPPVWMFDLVEFTPFLPSLAEFFLTWEQLE